MKNTLIALAGIVAAGSASAQSSVTIFGVVDATLTFGRASGEGSGNRTSLGTGGNATSRFGFRGEEDLGGGLRAGFWLEGQIFNDDGTAGREIAGGNQGNTVARAQGLNFSRRSTVSLFGNWGEVRLGRDFVPTNYNWGSFDPFGNVGSAVSLILVGPTGGLNAGPAFAFQPAGQGTNGILVRASNMVSYFLPPNLGGVYGQVSYWLGENARNGAANEGDGSGGGFRIGYKQGPLNLSASALKAKYRATPVAATPGAPSGDLTSWNVGGEWNFGPARLMGAYTHEDRDSAVRAQGRGGQLGVVVPIGVNELKLAYSTYDIDAAGANPKARQLGLGLVHNLSKRTAVYGTIAHIRNSNGARIVTGGSVIGTGVSDARSTGVDFGIRHLF